MADERPLFIPIVLGTARREGQRTGRDPSRPAGRGGRTIDVEALHPVRLREAIRTRSPRSTARADAVILVPQSTTTAIRLPSICSTPVQQYVHKAAVCRCSAGPPARELARGPELAWCRPSGTCSSRILQDIEEGRPLSIQSTAPDRGAAEPAGIRRGQGIALEAARRMANTAMCPKGYGPQLPCEKPVSPKPRRCSGHRRSMRGAGARCPLRRRRRARG
jgi:hypothetical protein